jgi:hypothetical protein
VRDALIVWGEIVFIIAMIQFALWLDRLLEKRWPL